MSEEKINWDEAVSSDGFVTLKTEEQKVLVLRDWALKKVEKFDKEQIEFQAVVVEEDGEKLKGEKLFTTTSKRLKKKLRPIFENKKKDEVVKISVMKVGEQFNTQYSVKEITE
jgi:hypothetical protein